MKKIIFFIVLILFVNCLSISSNAYENISPNDVLKDLDNDTLKYFSNIGIDLCDLENSISNSPWTIIKNVFNFTRPILKETLKIVMFILIAIILISLVDAISPDEKMNDILSLIGAVFIISYLVFPINSVISKVGTCIKLSSIFINSYLPVMTAIILGCRQPAVACTYNSFTIIFANIISYFANKIFIPTITCLMSFNFITSFSSDGNKSRIFNLIKKVITIIIALLSTLFSGLMAVSSVLAYSKDSIIVKGFKFLSGNLIPVVGSSLSETFTTIIGSFKILKSSLGVIIIFLNFLISFPVILELILWYFLLELCSIFSSLLGVKYISDTFDNIASLISLSNIILLFISSVLNVTTSIIISMGKL